MAKKHRSVSTSNLSMVALSFVLFIGLWFLLSSAVGTDILPTPWVTILGIGEYFESGNLFSDLLVTFGRVVLALAIAFFIGVVWGVSLSLSQVTKRLIGSWVTIGASVPPLLTLVVCFLLLGLNGSAAVVGTGLVVAPSITFGVQQGMGSLQPEFSEMARAFGVPKRMVLRRVLMPQTLPFLFANARQGLSVTWMIMIFAELLGMSEGVGYRIQYWYQLFNMKNVLAAAIPFMLLMTLLEFGILRPLERHFFRWQREESR